MFDIFQGFASRLSQVASSISQIDKMLEKINGIQICISIRILKATLRIV